MTPSASRPARPRLRRPRGAAYPRRASLGAVVLLAACAVGASACEGPLWGQSQGDMVSEWEPMGGGGAGGEEEGGGDVGGGGGLGGGDLGGGDLGGGGAGGR